MNNAATLPAYQPAPNMRKSQKVCQSTQEGITTPVLRQRQHVLDVAYQLHPERFVRQAPKQPAVFTEVWINKPLNLEIKPQ
jgi:hypothetical protein